MRTVQVSVNIKRYGNQMPQDLGNCLDAKYGDIYRGISVRKGEIDLNNLPYVHLGIYADANDMYAAFCAAYDETAHVIEHFEKLPKCEDDDRFPTGGDNEVRFFVELFSSRDPYYTSKPAEPDKPGNRDDRILTGKANSPNVYEALVLAFNALLDETQKRIKLPVFGNRTNR